MKTQVIKTGRERVELVFTGSAAPAGYVSKLRDTRCESHPWKAYRYVPGVKGPQGLPVTEFLGSYYPEEGGKAAAINAAAS